MCWSNGKQSCYTWTGNDFMAFSTNANQEEMGRLQWAGPNRCYAEFPARSHIPLQQDEVEEKLREQPWPESSCRQRGETAPWRTLPKMKHTVLTRFWWVSREQNGKLTKLPTATFTLPNISKGFYFTLWFTFWTAEHFKVLIWKFSSLLPEIKMLLIVFSIWIHIFGTTRWS